jgi:hypothetical protein
VDVLNVSNDAYPLSADERERIVYDRNYINIASHLDETDVACRELRDFCMTKVNQQISLCVIIQIACAVARIAREKDLDVNVLLYALCYLGAVPR